MSDDDAFRKAADVEAKTPITVGAGRDDRWRSVELYAYLGEDELGSGEIGIKQGVVPSGTIPLVAIDSGKLTRPDVRRQLQAQATTYGKTIRLVRFIAVEDVLTLRPGG